MELNRLRQNSESQGKKKERRRLRIVIPQYPAFNIYSGIARMTTALGPVTVATAVHEIEGWDVEVIDENNYRRPGRPLNSIRDARPRKAPGGKTGRLGGALRRVDQHDSPAL